ncbi:MarR family transcriptional regulator [Nonomuraea sp. NPDC050394]|uniref:MarR family transcriptional regulator n=1 Tax=Nonomuraea sp. NPDC050394 TaxID=3364363 RepID=UPI0037B0C143
MHRPIGYWAKRLDAAIDEAFDRALARLGADRRQWQILTTLLDGAAVPAELSGALSPFDGVRDALAVLAARGLVAEEGGRVGLTAGGRRVQAKLAEAVAGVRGVVGRGVSEEEYAATVGVLARMVNNLDVLTCDDVGPKSG